MSDETCPNGHPANSEGNCTTSGCVYHVNNKHRGGPQR